MDLLRQLPQIANLGADEGHLNTAQNANQNVTAGSGKIAKIGDTVEVQYVGVLFDGGKEFDTSWQSTTKPGKAFSFKIGTGGVIKGWDQGVPGMKVGMRRVLVIPSNLAYGAQGSPPTIPADAPLVFAIDDLQWADAGSLRLLSFIASAEAEEVCACDLIEPSGRSQPTVSHHMKILVDAGLFRAPRVGSRQFVHARPTT